MVLLDKLRYGDDWRKHVADPAPAPSEYWRYRDLWLSLGSLDKKYAKKKKGVASVPHNYVSDLQADLIQLGYLKPGADDGSYGETTKRAVTRFQRHAKRSFRTQNKTKVVASPWNGAVTGACQQSTAREVRQWIDKAYRLPFGVFKIVAIDGGHLREDVAQSWNAAVADAKAKGGTLLPKSGPKYSDTFRSPAGGFTSTGGNSKYSLHYTGRAVDLSWAPTGGKSPRWFVVKEPANQATFWRIFCKTEKQDGSQGVKIATEKKKYFVFGSNTEKWFPEGYYLDLTSMLQSHGFERIPAQTGWRTKEKKREWWHFYYADDLQKTFLDEMELIGFAESRLRQFGWSPADLDHSPG